MTNKTDKKSLIQNLDYHPHYSLEMAQKRAELYTQIRQFFAKHGVMEVQTPILSQAGNTEVGIQSITAQITLDKSQTYYLHTSPEFAMKRLLAAWQIPIYQICPVFRDGELGGRHNPEFTMLEWYRPYYHLNQLAEELKDLLTKLFNYPMIFNHYRYADAFLDFVNIHPLSASCITLKAIAEDHGLFVDLGDDHQAWLDLLFSHLIEPHLGHDLPTFITDYPAQTAALAKVEIDKDGFLVAKRFELYIQGLEIANAYDELADPHILKQRFEKDNQDRIQKGLPQIPIDQRLLNACADLPPCSGIAVGLDRLLMAITQQTQIQDVIAFTTPSA